ncbi:cytochrome P450 [Fistulina hepatica ATCC 64428]|uniref:Cytochrome P450 n=1 Tax=Fistulina hepatica ATCC 64428 TaxID=1128425 RepID=A0A0D7A6T7_9AGAR|nr:cytochrome P450 [Fistulina hepatica ATCC 64428]
MLDIGCLSVFVALVLRLLRKYNSSLPSLPVPSGASWVWGHEKIEFEDDQGSQWKVWFKQYGKVFRLKSAWRAPDILVIGDPGGLKHMYSANPYNYRHSHTQLALVHRTVGYGLVAVEGLPDHRRVRSALSPAFSEGNVRSMGQDMYAAANGLQASLTSLLELHGGSYEIDITRPLSAVALDIIGRTALAHDFGAVAGDEQSRKMLELGASQDALAIQPASFVAMMVLRLFPWILALPIPAIEAQLANTKHARGIASEIIARGQDDGRNGRDVLSMLLRAHRRPNSAKSLSEFEICENAVTVMIAGHGTTSSTLAFTIWKLSEDKELQDQLRGEVSSFPAEPSFEQLNNLPLLDGVCKEGLRMFPPVPRNEKYTHADDVIPLLNPVLDANGAWLKEIAVKKGQIIHVPTIAVNRDDELWGDGDAFRPTRWLVGHPAETRYCRPGESGVRPAKELTGGYAGIFTFSEGPRMCLGIRMAIFEFKVILFTLVRHFVFSPADGVEVATRYGATLTPYVCGKPPNTELPVKVSLVS